MIKTYNIQNQVILERIQTLKMEVIQLQKEDINHTKEESPGSDVVHGGRTKKVRDYFLKQNQIRSEITEKKNQIIDLILNTDLI